MEIEKTDITPKCPFCKADLTKILSKDLDLGKEKLRALLCPHCELMLALQSYQTER